jgi:CHAD domain-containing protein
LSGEDPQAGRIHEVRKSIKRLRALTSLIARGLEDDKWFDDNLRDVNRALSPVRDAEALREAFDRLVASEESPPDELAVVRACLLSWSEHHEHLSSEVIHQVVKDLDRIERRWESASIDGHGWSLLENNVRRAYRETRRTLRALPDECAAADLHELRKCVKQTQYHWEFLQAMCPERLEAEVATLEAVSDALGCHHDAEMFKAWFADAGGHGLSERTQQHVIRRLDRQQRALEHEIRNQASAVFAERPRDVCDRLHDYWKHWHTADAASSPRKVEESQTAALRSVGP